MKHAAARAIFFFGLWFAVANVWWWEIGPGGSRPHSLFYALEGATALAFGPWILAYGTRALDLWVYRRDD